MSAKTVTLDVRADIRAGADPFTRIMGAVAALKANQRLRVIAPFKPVPLLGVMRDRGFTHVAKPLAGDDWEVVFTRDDAATELASPDAPCACGCAATPALTVDARGLEPPQPLVRILEALETLPEGAELHARTDRRPVHLFPHLEERGFVGESEAQPDGSFITRIHRC
jgi:uncharacterized protein (DUF2249 family)